MNGQLLLVRGQVQGVGFRPTVWRLASELGLTGDVRNTSEGVEIRLWGQAQHSFARRLRDELPTLACIDTLEVSALAGDAPEQFSIAASSEGESRLAITPDVASCTDCVAEVLDPFAHRYRYPFTNCTNCGPRFSIVEAAPYDRDKTTMREYAMCEDCLAEFSAASDRRFHAQCNACYRCGPGAWLEHLGGGSVNAEAFSMMDDVDAAGGAIKNGFIVALKGIGGVHLACDASKDEVVESLRERKRRPHKAFALMARDIDIIRRYALVSAAEEQQLRSSAAPVVLLQKRESVQGGATLAASVAPGLNRLGFMLPHTPLQHLMLRRMERPVVMTSGNISGQPQCVSNEQTREQLATVAEFALLNDRAIANRIDDSVLRVDRDRPRLLRRARGFAPAPLALPEDFRSDIQISAMGAELKNTFCLLNHGRAILSPHLGDLQNLHTSEEADRSYQLFVGLFDHSAAVYAVDQHPDYHSTRRGHQYADGAKVIEVQHHHAHIASCLAENRYALNAGPVLGIVMDGSGLGDDGTIWGGEFLIADYSGYRREACLKPVALPGAEAAIREPWRNAYAHLMAEMGWAELAMNFADLELFQRLEQLPRDTLDGMIQSATNSPLASSCGRLFDAAAAITGLAWQQQSFEGEAAMRFEAAVDADALHEPPDLIYPFTIPRLAGNGLPYIEPLSVWRAILGDLLLGTPPGTIAARFHRGLASAIVTMAGKLTQANQLDTVVLSGGCFQNAVLFELVYQGLEELNLSILSHSGIPANDGGIALGQAVVALAQLQQGEAVCV